MKSRRTFATRVLAVGMVCNVITGAAVASPGDIWTSAAPVIGADPAKATAIKSGDVSVASQTGALSYGYPITVPPNRGGMVPNLVLSYSSQGPTYGTIAAGWSLGIPEIREDASVGRLTTHHPGIEALQADPRADDAFTSTLAGGRPLVRVTEPKGSDAYAAYRAQNDSSFFRYERISTSALRWRVLAPDGTTHKFGESSLLGACQSISDGNAPLTTTVDAFGNTIRYHWDAAATTGLGQDDCRLNKITYGANASASVTDFAQVTFGYETSPVCANVPVGSATEYRQGYRDVRASSKLRTITAVAYPSTPGDPDHTRQITLGYAESGSSTNEESCSAQHSAVRLLTSIQESAWGRFAPRVDLPAVKMTYGAPAITLDQLSLRTTPWLAQGQTTAPSGSQHNLGWGWRSLDSNIWPTVEAMMVDVDGDGLVDRLRNESARDAVGKLTCRAGWERNRGAGQAFALAEPITFGSSSDLPMLKWKLATNNQGLGLGNTDAPDYELCSLNGQHTAYQNSHSTGGNICRDGSSCTSGSFCNDGYRCGGSALPPDTYLAYRWIDFDHDGRADLIAAPHGDPNFYDLERGNGPIWGPEEPLFGAWPACPGAEATPPYCRAGDVSCMSATRACSPGTACAVDWTATNACISSSGSDRQSCSKAKIDAQESPAKGAREGGDQTLPCCTDPTCEGPKIPRGQPGCPATETPSSLKSRRIGMMRCGGQYVWIVYRNLGHGRFSSTPVITYQPVPLESDQGDSSISSGSVSSQTHGIADLDGDGFPDAVIRAREYIEQTTTTGTTRENVPAWWWFMWHGNGAGGFDPQTYVFETRDGAVVSETGFASKTLASSAGLIDINGDGAADHWKGVNTEADIAFNSGTGFRLYGDAGGLAIGERQTPSGVKPGADAEAEPESIRHLGVTNTTPIVAGKRHATNRPIDVDNDGRIDVVTYDETSTSASVYFNQGGQFAASAASYAGSHHGVRQALHARDTGQRYTWELKGDLLDLDGDGIAEVNTFATPAGESIYVANAAIGSSPPRLLISVDNAHGAVTTVSYAQMHDGAVVEQHPELTSGDDVRASPHAQWVVKHTTTQDTLADTTSTTSYFYKTPRMTKDERGRWGFRGFDQVTTTNPAGAKVVERFSYAPDWSGRLTTTLVVPAESATPVQTIDETMWEAKTLFDDNPYGAITTYHATTADHWVCKNGQNEAACRANTDTRTRTVTTLAALASTTSTGGPALLWQPTATRLQAGATAGDGDRTTTTTFDLRADATTYRLRPRVSTKEVQIVGVATLYGKTEQTWDTTHRVPLTDEVWFTSDASTRAITRREYDLNTGNLLRRWKPVQNAASTTKLENSYDARKLFVVTDVDEKGHTRDHAYDYGTGAKVKSSGPNVRQCATNTTTCLDDPTHPVKETVEDKVDGLGRPIEHWATVSSDGFYYVFTKTGVTSYVDTMPSTTTPTSVSTEQLVQQQTSIWKKDKTELDGHGRPIRKTIFVQGTAPANEITSWTYRADGTLATVSVPDPTANDASVVTYTYSFDSLGRPTSLRRPDATLVTDRSGVDMTYDGLTATTTEVVKTNDGLPATSRTTSDAFGRLIRVDEMLTGGASPTFASTNYGYSANDLVESITDPESRITTLAHDFAGRRTAITRGGRTWLYGYDKNGNRVSERVPGWTDEMDAPLFTTSTAYDDLDRPSSRFLGHRDLSAPDVIRFGADHETFIWDTSFNNRVGRLAFWRSFAPGASTPTNGDFYFYDALGHQNGTWGTFAEFPGVTRQFGSRKNLLGGEIDSSYYDDVIMGSTHSETVWDVRGYPTRMRLNRPGEVAKPLAVQTRNVAGLVTKRRTDNASGAPMPYIESNWTYDKLGRVTQQSVIKGNPSPNPASVVVQQDLAYNGTDNPKSLDHYLGTNHKHFDYEFDRRHQLTAADETTTAGYFSADYGYGAAGRLAAAFESVPFAPPTGCEVVPRDVTYQYGDPDRERVTALLVGSVPFRSYAYDAAGNQTLRCNGAISVSTCVGPTSESFEYLYDGRDRLRRATKKIGAAVQGTEEYWYDGKGARFAVVKKTAAGSTTETIWTIGNTEAHYDSTNTVTHIYAHLTLGTPVARVDRTDDTTTTLELQFHGLASSTIAAVAEDGTINASFSYAPFGEVIESVDGGGFNGLAQHRRRMNDKYVDELSGLSYYGARYYDKTMIGWTQADPLYRFAPEHRWTEPRRALLYSFSLLNPLKYIDPDGRDPIGSIILGVIQPLAPVALARSHQLGGEAAKMDPLGEGAVIVEQGIEYLTNPGHAAGKAYQAADHLYESVAAGDYTSATRDLFEYKGFEQAAAAIITATFLDVGILGKGGKAPTGRPSPPTSRPKPRGTDLQGELETTVKRNRGTSNHEPSSSPNRCSGPNSICGRGAAIRGQDTTSGGLHKDPTQPNSNINLCDRCYNHLMGP